MRISLSSNLLFSRHLFSPLVAAAALIVIALTGCGYTYQGARTTLPAEVKRIYIPQVENNSVESGFGVILTDALRDQFEKFGALTVVDSRMDADAVLNTTVVKIKRTTRTTTGTTDSALQYDTTVTIDSVLKRRNGTVLWQTSNLTISKGFGGTANSVADRSAAFNEGTLSAADLAGLSNQEVLRSQQGSSLRSVAGDVARKIYSAAVVGDF